MVSFVKSVAGVFGLRSGVEQPPYRVVEKLGAAVEVRRYRPRVAAETVANDRDLKTARRTAFERLYAYISGANRRGPAAVAENQTAGPEAIAMTAPVETAFAAQGALTMRFLLPSGWTLKSAPPPADGRVRIVELPEQTIAVLRFSGNRSAQTIAFRTTDLMGALEVSVWKPVGRPFAWLYDPPWTLPPCRRNEVGVVVVRR